MDLTTLQFSYQPTPKNSRSLRAFRFHNLWLREDDCENLIKCSWQNANGVDEKNINKILFYQSKDLITRNKKKMGKVEEVITSTRAELESIRYKTPCDDSIVEGLELSTKFDEYLVKRRTYGDRNLGSYC